MSIIPIALTILASGPSYATASNIAVTTKAKEPQRLAAAEEIFSAMSRYNGPAHIQFARCHVGRTYEQIRQYDYRQRTEQEYASFMSPAERLEYKAALYALLRSPDAKTRQRALEHVVILADHTDQSRMKSLLANRLLDRGRVLIGLGRVGSEKSIPLLASELAGPYREMASEALKNIGSEKALEAIRNGPLR